jgi:hypothetical protein
MNPPILREFEGLGPVRVCPDSGCSAFAANSDQKKSRL